MEKTGKKIWKFFKIHELIPLLSDFKYELKTKNKESDLLFFCIGLKI